MRELLNRSPPTSILIIGAGLIAGASIILKSEIARTINHAPHDDSLFLRLAESLGDGAWLGPYDNLTLAKGAVYPLFLALTSASQLPLNLTEHAIYIAGAALIGIVTTA